MKIGRAKDDTTIFELLNDGDVFVYNNLFFMKTERREYGDITINAVRMDSGGLTDFNDDDVVAHIDGEFIIQR